MMLPSFIGIARAQPSASALWTPANLSTPAVGWFDANDTSTITLNGSTVSAWGNKGSVGGSGIQSIASSQPLYQSTGFNSKPTLLFTASSSNYLDLNTLLFSDPDTVYILNVSKLNSASTSRIVFGHRSETTRLIQVTYQDTTTVLWQLRASNNVLQQPGVTATFTNPHFVEAEMNVPANSHYIRTNAGTPSTNTYNFGTNNFTSTQELIGATFVSSPVAFFDGLLSELIILNFIPSANDVAKLQGYVAHKWGLTANLPSDHPYKSTAPTI